MIQTAFDARDAELLKARIEAREKLEGPRIGDFVYMGGTLRRFTHDWGEDIQVTPEDHLGSFCLLRFGGASYSGSLDPAISKDRLVPTGMRRNGRFWFFHHDLPGAGRGVHCEITCRVYHLRGES